MNVWSLRESLGGLVQADHPICHHSADVVWQWKQEQADFDALPLLCRVPVYQGHQLSQQGSREAGQD